MLKFKIRHQQISRVDNFRPVEKSVNYLYAEFDFLTSDWDGAEKKAVCRNVATGISYDARITGDKCKIPWEAIDKNGKFEIAVHGTVVDVKIPTNAVTVDLGRTLPSGTESNPPSPTELDLIKQDVADLRDQVENLDPSAPGNAGFVVQNTEPEDTSVLWIDPDDDNDDGFQEAVNTALAQAKESGLFDGAPGHAGPQGETGPQGIPGDDYVLTDEDKTEIAEEAAKLVEVPEGGGIAVTGATVGQTVKISAVDEKGVPTAWEPVDFPSGGGGPGRTIETLISDTITEEGVTEYKRQLTSDEVSKINSSTFIRLTSNTNQSAVAMAGVQLYLWSNYGHPMGNIGTVNFGTGNNSQQHSMLCIELAEDRKSGINQKYADLAGIKTELNSVTNVYHPNGFAIHKNSRLHAKTTTETGFPVGTTITLEVG